MGKRLLIYEFVSKENYMFYVIDLQIVSRILKRVPTGEVGTL